MWLGQFKINTPSFIKFSALLETKGLTGRVSSLDQKMEFLQLKKFESKSMSLQNSPFIKISTYTV